ncbi:MAG: serine/threonine protein kinase [Deltaproteobacteria bacterium]|nr:serine/threonine protein kinase [Deltaproteobacteria bacterium]
MSRPDVATVAQMFAGLYGIIEPMPWNGLAPTYKAAKDGTPVVVAVLPIDAGQSPEAAALFEARAKALLGLDHPRLLPVTAQGVCHGVPYLEMPYVEGEPLDRIVDRVPLQRDRAVTIARRILRALELLEAVNILHLDLTPSNILVVGEDDVRVMGTGVAATLREVRDTDKTGPTGKGSGPSPGRYLAPEVLVGDKVDGRSDIYSVGTLLHYMLTGHPMGKGGPPPPEDLAPIIARATRRLRTERYATAALMRTAIDATGAKLSVAPPAMPSSPAAAATPTPAPIKKTRTTLVIVLATIVIAAVSVGVVRVSDIGRESDGSRPASPAPSQRAEEALPTPSPALEPSEETPPPPVLADNVIPEPPLRTDLLGGDLPEPLDTIWPRVSAGEALSRGDRRLVAHYASENRSDPRPRLLFAREFMARGWATDAIAEYNAAFDADPECVLDRRMLDDLVDLARRTSTAPAAMRAVRRIYGMDALPRVDEALAGELDGSERRRLERLRERLMRP